jgi:hypothetical protein
MTRFEEIGRIVWGKKDRGEILGLPTAQQHLMEVCVLPRGGHLVMGFGSGDLTASMA